MKVILFSGPPRAGKDTAAKLIGEYLGSTTDSVVRTERFAEPLEMAAGFCGLDTADAAKEVQDWVFGVSRRQFQIALSENYFKFVYGKEIFGKILLRKILMVPADFVLVPDSGFVEEAQVLLGRLGATNVIRCHIERSGCTYAGDSRSDWDSPPALHTFRVRNNSTFMALQANIVDGLNRWLYP